MLRQFKGDSLTSSEPSRQLSCPSQRRLADTQPPLVHTYSLTEQDGTTAGEKRVTGRCSEERLSLSQVDLWDCGWSETAVTSHRVHAELTVDKKKMFLWPTKDWILHACNTNNVVDNRVCTKEGGSVGQCAVGGFFTCFLAVFFIFTHLAIFLSVTQPLHRDAQVVVTAKLVVWAVCLTAFLQVNTEKNIKDTSTVQQPDCFLFSPPAGRKQKTTSYIIHSVAYRPLEQLTQRSLTQSVTMKKRSEGLTNVHMNRCSNTNRPTLLEPRSAPDAACTLWLRRRTASSICVCEHRVRTTRVVSEKSCLNVHVVYSAEHFKWSIRLQSCRNAVITN